MSAAEQIELMEIKNILRQILQELRNRPTAVPGPFYEPAPYWQNPHWTPPRPGSYPDVICKAHS